jgi:EmrB/QacA subfamily drug resistance transporter
MTNFEPGRYPVHDNAGPLVIDAPPPRQAPPTAAVGSAPQAARDQRSRWVALIVLCTGMLMIVLDMTIVNVALPSIQTELGFSQSGLAWVINAYLIPFGGLLLLGGRLGDLAGRRNVFLAGLAVFTASSLLCGLAQNQGILIAARFVQGTGGALTSAVILGMIVTMFPEPREQARAIGFYAFVASAGGAVGLLAGGILTEAISWHWIFFVNIPVGIATAALAPRVISRDQGIGLAAGADFPGAVLITGAMMLGVYTIVKPAAELGWLAPRTLGLGVLSLALLAGFVVRQLTARHPLMPLRILASRTVSGANLIQVVGAAGMLGTFFLGSLYLQRILGYNPLQIGLAFLPVAVVMGTLSVRYSERLVTRFGARTTLLPGLVLIAAGLVVFAQLPPGSAYLTRILPVMLLLGAGAGICFPALMTLSMSAATPEDAGVASGLVNTTAQVGGALGLAVLATASGSRTRALLASGHDTAAALTGGYQLAFWIAAGLVAAAIVIAVALLPASRRPGAASSRPPAGQEGEI